MVASALERQFKIHFNANINKFKIIAYGHSSEITILSWNKDFSATFIFTLRKRQVSNTPISIALADRSLKSPFIDCLKHLVGRDIDIFLGYFSINAFERVRACKEAFSNYNFKVSEPTHLDGALLDYVYKQTH